MLLYLRCLEVREPVTELSRGRIFPGYPVHVSSGHRRSMFAVTVA